MNYPMIIYPCEEGGFVAEIPVLPGCLAQGETLEETLQELMTVKSLWLETAEKDGQKFPDLENTIINNCRLAWAIALPNPTTPAVGFRASTQPTISEIY